MYDPKLNSRHAWITLARHANHVGINQIVISSFENEKKISSISSEDQSSSSSKAPSRYLLFDHGQIPQSICNAILPKDQLDQQSNLTIDVVTIRPREGTTCNANEIQKKTKGVGLVLEGSLAASTEDGTPVISAQFKTLGKPPQYDRIHVGLAVSLGAGSPVSLRTTIRGLVDCLAPEGRITFTVWEFENESDLSRKAKPVEMFAEVERTAAPLSNEDEIWNCSISGENWNDVAQSKKSDSYQHLDGVRVRMEWKKKMASSSSEIEYDPSSPEYSPPTLDTFYVTRDTLFQVCEGLGLAQKGSSLVWNEDQHVSFGQLMYCLRSYVFYKPAKENDNNNNNNNSSRYSFDKRRRYTLGRSVDYDEKWMDRGNPLHRRRDEEEANRKKKRKAVAKRRK